MSQSAFNPSRRQLFRGDTGSKHLPTRPPWSVTETDFTDQCSRCGDCISQCPEQILIKGSGGFPEVDFKRGECTFCQECVSSCKAPVFRDPQESPWSIKAVISDRCIAHKQVVCRSCVEQCDPEAISLKLKIGGVGTPEIKPEQCTGCGACVAVCPTQAILIQAPQNETTKSTPQMTSQNDK